MSEKRKISELAATDRYEMPLPWPQGPNYPRIVETPSVARDMMELPLPRGWSGMGVINPDTMALDQYYDLEHLQDRT